jgi:hypothetical protein
MVDVNFTVKALFYIGIVLFLIWIGLIGSQHHLCYNELRNSKTACKSDSYRIDPHEGDSLSDLTQRLWNYTNIDSEKVFWRRSIGFSVISVLIIFFIVEQRLPEILEFLISVLILYIFFYQMNSYYSMHVDFRSNIFAQQTINKLRENLGLREPTKAKDFTYL